MELKRAHVFISGRVQGVFFRSYTRDMANRYGIKGWVRNLPDRRVEAVFEGKATNIDKMLKWCAKGSPHSKVTLVDFKWEEYSEEFDSFYIKYY